ncbi:uracil-DNA glycosylase [Boudabousia marimammalium]|uniref:Uracil-DNA glycosylase n=1 Tax=Boudabousia marimammalium TaxID=156892 RepID=A0A1Q5PJ81_9ACTO|nr:uracil-DNA glycosylase [Boudabousia marimammalium]OKL45916.1 uracil-DNA glycosylase [Boudabousia marimammalium]
MENPSLANVMAPDWAEALSAQAEQIRAMGQMLRAENAAGKGYLPQGRDVFRAFTYPLADVKVLIVGQDPYPTPGHAMGLSFSVQPGVEIPRSLQNIFTEMVSDLGVERPTSGDLSPWSKQGVMLLNRVLTVQPGAAASHRKRGWEQITDAAIDALVARQKPLVAILWGRDAQQLIPRLTDTAIIKSPHPSPLSASRGFFGSKPFSHANQHLTEMGASPVDWRLP